MKYFHHRAPFVLESGQVLAEITIAYHTYGTLNEAGDNVIWVCHALTANSAVAEWWPGMVGDACIFNTSRYFIVCANILGSCYGTTGPLSPQLNTDQPFYHAFPFITIRDMVQAHQALQEHLGIQQIHLLVGGSMGGYQALEWSIMQPNLISNLFLVATTARESAWGIAIHATQRLAIEADATWTQPQADAGSKGLKTARAIGMLTYRSFATYAATQTDEELDKIDDFKAASYINYQGNKLVKRFNAFSYFTLTKAMDSHNIARHRGAHVQEVLATVKAKTLVVGINSDLLCPASEHQVMAAGIPGATYVGIDSLYGHDGFLIEVEKLTAILKTWLLQ